MPLINLNDPNIGPQVDTTQTTTSQPAIPSTGTLEGIDVITSGGGAPVTTQSIFALPQEKPLTILEYANIINTAIENLRVELDAIDVLDALSMKKFHLSAALDARSLAQMFSDLLHLQELWHSLVDTENSQINAQNIAITNYNSSLDSTQNPPGSDKKQVDAINLAIDQYNQGLITQTQFQAYVDAYNAYAQSRNTTLAPSIQSYNAQTGTFNQQVDANNAQAAYLNNIISTYQLNLPAVPTEPGAPTASGFSILSPPYNVPISHVSAPVDISQVPQTPQPPQQNFIDTFWGPMFNIMMPVLLNITKQLELAAAYRDQQKLNLHGGVIVLPAAYIQQCPETYFSGGVGTNISTTSAIGKTSLGLDTEVMDRIIAQNIYDEALGVYDFPLSPQFNTLMKIFSVELLGQVGLFSALPTIALLGTQASSLDISSSTFELAKSSAVAELLRDVVQSGITSTIVQDFLRQSLKGPVDHTDFKNAVRVLSANLDVVFLLVALFHIATALGSPRLIAQILNNLGLQGALQSAVVTPASLSVGDVLSNAVMQGLLKSALAEAFVKEINYNNSVAVTEANAAINNVLVRGPYESNAEFQQELANTLAQAGISPEQAASLAATATAFVEAQQAQWSQINNAGSAEAIAALLGGSPTAAAVLDGISAGNIRTQILTDSIFAQIIARGFSRDDAQNIVDRAVNAILSQVRFENEFQIRKTLEGTLAQFGVNPFDAAEIAALAIISQRNSSLPSDLIFSNSSQGTAGIEELKALVYEESFALLTGHVPTSEASQIATRITQIVFGTDKSISITSLLNDRLAIIQELAVSTVQAELVNTMREFLNPTIDLFMLARRIRDPANTLILSLLNGVMYASELPKNFQRTVDFLV